MTGYRSMRRRRSLRILMLTSEAVPFAKSGGLADAVSALADELCRMGHDVRLVMPRYYFNDRSAFFRTTQELSVDLGGERLSATVYEGRFGQSGVPCFFLDHEPLYGRDGIYGIAGKDFPDNHRRFGFLATAALDLCEYLNWEPHIIHGHDWPAGLMPVLARRRPFFTGAATVFTIHNLAYHGMFDPSVIPESGLAWDDFLAPGFAHYGKLSFLRAGIHASDAVTTVSPTYAGQILTPAHGSGVDTLLRRKARRVRGILNGVDYTAWDPETDVRLIQRYGPDSLADKIVNRSALRQVVGLADDADTPLFVFITRLVEQKGLAALLDPRYGCLERILQTLPVQIAVIGVGHRRYELELSRLAARYPNLTVTLAFDETLAHRFYASGDFLLMPSLFEPCGLNQMYALRYGTLPVVTATGGLVDTVEPIRMDGDRPVGTGILIRPGSDEELADGIYTAVTEALALYRQGSKLMDRIRREAMARRFSWADSAQAYVDLYRELG